MLPAQRSSLSSYVRWFRLAAVVSGFQAWIRQEIVDDDPWDAKTLSPSSSTLPLKESDREEPNSEESIF
jgi:cytoskeletal protein RodZ